ncbi:hypothetical protein ANCDUO_04176 [Ancylostoma duodenale]|uniref:Uncharacterized protein n=1 Tax=Ancylostoma duodenale TaxID=51022 RepID=A0A0C2DRW6_9BILA|nr:hypothetical protein ANCDUO_04176 [Ancylostoma duodenale]
MINKEAYNNFVHTTPTSITHVDRITSEKIRERFGIATIADKLRGTCLSLYGHVLRANKDTICKVGLDPEVPGKGPKGRPKQHTACGSEACGRPSRPGVR